MIIKDQYQRMYEGFKAEVITVREWEEYCEYLFDLHLIEAKEVFIRLKEI